MKHPYKLVLAAYILFLGWLVLFKFSSDPLSVLMNYHTRSLNLVPFSRASGSVREMIYNFVVFVPLGLLAALNYRQVSLGRKLAWIAIGSIAAETLQYVCAIGRTDITDVITNVAGGLCGLLAYEAAARFISSRLLNRCIGVVLCMLMLAFLWLRFFVFMVRY